LTSAIERLLNPRSIAVVGASGDPEKLTGRPVGYLQKYGFRGEIFPVNPRMPAMPGLTCYPDVRSLPAAPDVGLVLVGQERAEAAVRELAARGTAAAIVLASGYAETGAVGAERQEALKAAAGSMRVLGPNTIGLVNLTDRVVLSASGALEMGDLPVSGRISVVSQSGGVLGSLLSRAADRGIGFAKLVSTGNEADIDTAEMLAWLVEDPGTAVLAVYMEGLRRPTAFRRAAERAAALGKPIVVFKVGRSEEGARSVASHTGALAGTDRLYDALFRQLGMIRAQTFNDLLDIPAALAAGRRARGRRVAILTSTGGAGTLVADSCGLAGLEMPLPDPETAKRLAALQEGNDAAARRNPIDVTLAGLRPELLRAAIAALLDSPSYDSVVVVAGASALAQPNLAADAAAACLAGSDKPLIAYVSPHAPQVVRLFNARGIPAVAAPETCAVILDALSRAIPDRSAPPEPLRVADAAPIPTTSGPLDEAESKALFARFGIACVREIAVSDANEAETAARGLGNKVVVKVRSRMIAHKSDVGGVKVGVAADDVPAACAEMRAAIAARGLKGEGFLVQELISDSVEVILGFRRDPQLGPAVLVGLGGVAAELFDDTALRLLPIARRDAKAMVGELKTAPLLTGYRGAPARDVAALVDAILAFARMGETLGDRLVEAEINPLFVLTDGKGVLAADGLVVLR
jgi:acyl-CoA synthetase (NDP forming)